jgi:hypothetical protein
MFKTTQDKQSDIARTASHATKPFATGRVEVLPPDARPWEEVYLTFKEQYVIAITKLDASYVLVRDAERKLLATLPDDVFRQTVKTRALHAAQVEHYKAVLGSLRRDCERAARNSLAYCFMRSAQRVLTNEQYQICHQSAEEMKAGMPSSEPLPVTEAPPPVWNAAETAREKDRRKESFTAALHPNSNRVKRMADKAAKYGRSNAPSDRARGADHRVVHKEF